MSIKIMTRVWSESEAKSSKLLLLLAIADIADDNGFAWPGMDLLAEKIRMTTQSVRNLTQELMQAGELVKISRADQGRTNLYIVMTSITDEELQKARDKAESFGGGQIFLPPKCALGGGQIAIIEGGQIAIIPDPSLPVIEPSDDGSENTEPRPSVKEDEDNRPISYYFKDKKFVTAMGRVASGPWSVTCEDCGGDVIISKRDTPTECLCGMHEYILLSKKPGVRKKMHPAVLVLRKKIGNRNLNQEQVNLVESVVGTSDSDLNFWREVIEAWMQHGWYEKNVKGMLDWYERRELPTTGKKRGEEGGGETTHTVIEHPEVETPNLTPEEFVDAMAQMGGVIVEGEQ